MAEHPKDGTVACFGMVNGDVFMVEARFELGEVMWVSIGLIFKQLFRSLDGKDVGSCLSRGLLQYWNLILFSVCIRDNLHLH